ncbi:MAG: sugar phosphate isomerase/epimerase family protein [Longimicrobiales bacterium]
MDRRQFVGTAAALTAAELVSGCSPEPGMETSETSESAARSEPPAPLSPPLERVGVQLYTVRSLMETDVEATLGAVADIGYQEVEFAGYFGTGAAQLRRWLDDNGLDAVAAHVDPSSLTDRLDETLEFATTVGHRWLIQAFTPEAERTVDGYRRVADTLNSAGEAAASAGIRIGYHNHAFEFDPVGESTGMEMLLEHLDPEWADLEIDLHWAAAGGADVGALYNAHPGRFRLCHVKGRDAGGGMVDVGAGVMDWAGLFAMSDLGGIQHYLVEHDSPEDPLASIRASYRYLTGA